jgi:hypothetical protein
VAALREQQMRHAQMREAAMQQQQQQHQQQHGRDPRDVRDPRDISGEQEQQQRGAASGGILGRQLRPGPEGLPFAVDGSKPPPGGNGSGGGNGMYERVGERRY